MNMQQGHSISREWHDYYQREAALKQFDPEHDPYEPHRCTFALQLRLGIDHGAGDGRFEHLATRLGARCESALDAGCGDGYFASVLRRGGVRRVAGSDISLPRLQRARAAHPGIAFERADLYCLPFVDGGFDTVFCVEVVEHTEHPVEAIGELARVSARWVVITVPYDRPVGQMLCPHCGRTFYIDGHIQRFDPAGLRQACRAAGLRVRAVRGYVIRPDVATRPFFARGKLWLRQRLAGAGLVAPRRPKYLGALCEVPG